MNSSAIPSPADNGKGNALASRAGLPFTNFVALGSGEIMARVIAFAVAALLTRRLGATGFGELAFATAIASYLIVVPNMALQDLGSRAVAREPGAAPDIVASVTRVRVMLGVCGALAVALLALVLPVSSAEKTLVVLSGLGVIPQALNSSWAHKALERVRSVSGSLVLAQAVVLVAVVALVRRDGDLLRVPVIQAAGEMAAAALLFPLVRMGWRRSSFSAGLAVVRGAGTVIVNRLLRAVIVTADMVLLGFLVKAEQVGLYSAAYRVCFLLTAIAASAHVVFQPALMRAHDDPPRASAVLSDALWMAWTIGLPLVVGGMFVAPDLLALLFGEPFREAAVAFRILLFSTGILFLHGALFGAYMARRRLRLQMAIVGAAAALNLLLNALLIGPLGIVGSAVATVAAECLILVSSAVVLWRWRWRPKLHTLAKPGLAGIGMLLALQLLPAMWHVTIRIVFAGAVYAMLLVVLGALPPQIRHALQRLRVRA